MTLTTGTKLGAFEITGKLGAGGMGEVFRATDIRLGRAVAIKMLPASLAGDSDQLARFEREAKLLASLNHAHIGSIYSFDEYDGGLYIAMELIEGETLEEKLKSGALPVEDALQLGLQVASALEAAHEKGVIHRDLKPANIIVAPDGVAKVVDFGLAKAFSTGTAEPDPLHSPTLSAAMTQQGLILGTAGYMSPEQASGQSADQRADIWAFGAVLYEMLVGLPAFRGESVPHILAAVLQAEPEWERLPESLNRRVRELLESCLEKKPRNRFHHIADVRIGIERTLAEPEGFDSRDVEAHRRARPARMARLAGALSVAAALSAAVTMAVLRAPAEPDLTSRFAHLVPQAEFSPEAYLGRRVIGISPDGGYFVYRANSGLMLRSLDELEARAIPGADVGSWPVIAPSGDEIGYFYDGELRTISANGGRPDVIASGIVNPLGLSWADGEFLLGQPGGIFRVNDSGGELNLVVEARSEGERLYDPQLLPGGDLVLFTVVQASDWQNAEIVVESRSTGRRTILVRRGTDARYISAGYLVWARGESLLAAAFDREALTIPDDQPQPSIIQGVYRTGTLLPTRAANFALSDSGTLIYLLGFDSAPKVSLVRVDRSGAETGAVACTCQDISLSPDKTRIAIQAMEPSGTPYIEVYSFELDSSWRLTAPGRLEAVPVWDSSADRVVYLELGGGLYSRDAQGSDAPTLFHNYGGEPYGFGPDGELLVARAGEISALTPVDSIDVLISGEFNANHPALSPNGRWLAYDSNETGTTEVYVVLYPDISNKTLISRGAGGGHTPQWDEDGNLFFVGLDPERMAPDRMMHAPKDPDSDFNWLPAVPLFLLEGYNMAPPHPYAVTQDGGFLMMKANQTEDARIVVVQHWLDELTGRMGIE